MGERLRNDKLMKGAGKSQPKFFRRGIQRRNFFDHRFERLIGNQARRSATGVRLRLSVRDRDLTAAHFLQRFDRGRDVAIVRADDNEIVRIVRHGRAKCTALKTKSANKSNANISGRAMALDHDQFQNIAVDVGDDLAIERSLVFRALFSSRSGAAQSR